MRSNRHKVEHRKLQLHIRKHLFFFNTRVVIIGQVLEEGAESPSFEMFKT